jgi:prepilin-type N-terminal cleavage/methylation domain-containing protein
MNRRRAFTLVELLVVIAVIAIVAATVYPIFAGAREKARVSTCVSNTRQLAQAVHMYAADYEEKIPILGILAEGRGRWMWQVKPYVKSNAVFTDPNTPKNAYDGSRWTDRTGYGWSGVLQAASDPGMRGAEGYTLSAIAKPAGTIVMGDTGYDGAAGWCLYTRDPRKAPGSDARPGYWPQFRHHTTRTKPMLDTASRTTHRLPTDGMASFCFLDGHAKALPVGTAFREEDVEDGAALASPAISEAQQPANTRYVLWNIY